MKTIGTGVLAGTVLTGSARAGDWNDERRQDTFTWAQNDVYEMLASEPENQNDSEGDDESHRPLWLIASMEGTGVPGSEHSPHFHRVDHVVPLVDFSAQWHVHAVVDGDKNFIDHDDDPNTRKIPNLVNQDDSGTYLTSADRVNSATGVDILDFDFTFTCPVRPHNHHR